MEKKKLNLNEITVASFKTQLTTASALTVKAGDAGGATALCKHNTNDIWTCAYTFNEWICINPTAPRYDFWDLRDGDTIATTAPMP